MVNAIVSWILSFLLKVFDYILGIILTLISPVISDNFANFVSSASSYLQGFWGYCMSYFMYVRSIFDINTFEMGLIVELLTIALLHKPLILSVKLLVRWFRSLHS